MHSASDLFRVLDNRILLVALIACLLAQVSKLVVHRIKHGEWNWRVTIETGGMPSSHSALVTALASGVGQTVGWDSMEFAIASIFAGIVMYDAAGVRRAAGKQAEVLNQMIERFPNGHELTGDRLKELLGHTPFQVMVGSALGLFISWIAAPTY